MMTAKNNYLPIILTIIAPLLAALLAVWVHQHAVTLGYRLAEAEQQQRILRESEQTLQVELAAVTTPALLVRLAAELGLAPPGQGAQHRLHLQHQ